MLLTGMENGPLWLAVLAALLLIVFTGAGLVERRRNRRVRSDARLAARAAFRRDWGQDGQALVEYLLVIVLIAMIALVALATTGTWPF